MDDIERFLDEDLNKEGDITTQSLFSNEKGEAKIIAKEEGIVAGLKEAEKVFKKTGANFKQIVKDGDFVEKKRHCCNY